MATFAQIQASASARHPLPPPIDGDNASECLAELTKADNAAWNALDAVWNDPTKTDTERLQAFLLYLAQYMQACAAYYSCMGVIPPM